MHHLLDKSECGETKNSVISLISLCLRPIWQQHLHCNPLKIQLLCWRRHSDGVVSTARKCNSGKCPVNVHDLKALSLDSSRYFHRLRTTLYFSVVVVSPDTLWGTTLIRTTVLFSRFSDSMRSKVSPTFT